MKRRYLSIFGILAVAFLFFLVLSIFGDLDLGGGIKLRASGMAQALLTNHNKPQPSTSENIDNMPSDSIVIEKHHQVVLDTSEKIVLLIGDSMLEGLSPRLGAYCGASGHKLYTIIWYGSTTELFGSSKLITDYIRKLHPDYIFISLGGNELYIKDIAEKRQPYVKNILAEIDTIPYLWIGPPNWRKDTGINSLLKTTLPKGTFFESNGMKFDRKKDGAHPTSESAAQWMDSILRWMPDSAAFVIQFKEPEIQSMRGERIFIHQPGELTNRP